MFLDFFAGYFAAGFEGIGVPHLKLAAKADKSDLTPGREARVRTKLFRKDDTAVPIDAENLDVAVERDREFVPLIRIIREAREKPVDFLRKSLAAAIEGRSIERGVAVDAAGARTFVAVALEDGAKRGWD